MEPGKLYEVVGYTGSPNLCVFVGFSREGLSVPMYGDGGRMFMPGDLFIYLGESEGYAKFPSPEGDILYCNASYLNEQFNKGLIRSVK